MATLKVLILEKRRKQVGTYPVFILITWKRMTYPLQTEYYVTHEQVRRSSRIFKGKKIISLELKDNTLINTLAARIGQYELAKQKLGTAIENYTAKELADYFVEETTPKKKEMEKINYISFSREHIAGLFLEGRRNTARPMQSVLNNLEDYAGDFLDINDVTRKFLDGFYNSLRKERTMTRLTQFGTEVILTKPPTTDLKTVMTHIRTLFNAAKRKYNDEDKQIYRILHYPFSFDKKETKKLKPKPPVKKLLSIEQLRQIRDFVPTISREELAKDVFMLSFYLAGTNCADFYYLEDYQNGRISYNRCKVKNRREDEGYITMAVNPEAAAILNKYKDPTNKRACTFSARYSTHEKFLSAVDTGLRCIAKKINLPKLSTYFARFTFASIAYNKCGIPKDVVDLCLNHVDQGMKMADTYIERDFKLVDDALVKVFSKLSEE